MEVVIIDVFSAASAPVSLFSGAAEEDEEAEEEGEGVGVSA